MKIFFLSFLLLTLNSFACEDKPAQLELPRTVGKLFLDDISPIIKAIVKEEAEKDRRKMHLEGRLKYTAVTKTENPEKFTVFGYTEKEVLDMVADPNGEACGSKHIHDDLANRWCHGAVVKFIDGNLRAAGVNKVVSALLGASVFLPKEYLIDLHPSKADLVIADYEIFNVKDSKGSNKATITIFGDGLVFINFTKKF